MKVNFEQDDELGNDEVIINLRANSLSGDVLKLLQQLENWNEQLDMIPITTEDRTVMVQTSEILAIEVYGSELTIHTITKDYVSKGQLKTILERLNNNDFIQVAKSTVININQLDSLEAAFSGNMTAIMTNQLKISVSRKYLPELRRQLRM
ncbi:LytTR family DNA-binding domain-containing protein [Dellaglioa carnosa]|uniref:LytTR family transcriptional regulator n=1 Tax=Dellaglioa carnosa TaxID=2995136 RepID=A0ABT4JLC5_9LACO|nr:LytTR family DNA-binding domain-containing protein [Dellaglioa carnosa]MCZ2491172.1 LytTR family transcriptional regulator [Dellaglioa carnosa]MCZ2494250.1 LytTR family transcriptional regulator [Dellaglioa carnosa]MDK1731334.1 LytTR family transcriptional regulator [Dellaglioa carnosa]